MPKFVWEINARGQWRPQLFHGELPREMTMPHNAGRYVVHELPAAHLGLTLHRLTVLYPPPPPFTGKENSDAI